jgi:hypothetical protein
MNRFSDGGVEKIAASGMIAAVQSFQGQTPRASMANKLKGDSRSGTIEMEHEYSAPWEMVVSCFMYRMENKQPNVKVTRADYTQLSEPSMVRNPSVESSISECSFPDDKPDEPSDAEFLETCAEEQPVPHADITSGSSEVGDAPLAIQEVVQLSTAGVEAHSARLWLAQQSHSGPGRMLAPSAPSAPWSVPRTQDVELGHAQRGRIVGVGVMPSSECKYQVQPIGPSASAAVSRWYTRGELVRPPRSTSRAEAALAAAKACDVPAAPLAAPARRGAGRATKVGRARPEQEKCGRHRFKWILVADLPWVLAKALRTSTVHFETIENVDVDARRMNSEMSNVTWREGGPMGLWKVEECTSFSANDRGGTTWRRTMTVTHPAWLPEWLSSKIQVCVTRRAHKYLPARRAGVNTMHLARRAGGLPRAHGQGADRRRALRRRHDVRGDRGVADGGAPAAARPAAEARAALGGQLAYSIYNNKDHCVHIHTSPASWRAWRLASSWRRCPARGCGRGISGRRESGERLFMAAASRR